MSSNDLFDSYVEALNALSSVESHRRDALRRAVETASATKDRAKTQMADQQRMYDRAGKDVQDAERLLAELRSMLGMTRPVVTAPNPHERTPPQLVEIRAHIGAVAQWATETRSVAESLLRTKARLANAPKPVVPARAPAAVVQAPRPKKIPVGVIAIIVTLIIVVIVAVALITH